MDGRMHERMDGLCTLVVLHNLLPVSFLFFVSGGGETSMMKQRTEERRKRTACSSANAF